MHSKCISLMDLTCGRIDRFFSFSAIRLQRLCKLRKTFYHISYLSSLSPGIICLVELIASVLPSFLAINHDNKSCGQVCLLSPFRSRLNVLPLAGLQGEKPQPESSKVNAIGRGPDSPMTKRTFGILYKMPLDSLLKFDLLQYFITTLEVT